MIHYRIPARWVAFEASASAQALTEAKAGVISLREMPYQRSWIERLQAIEFKREIAGTSRIEGADFTERELDEAIKKSPENLLTRSQRQAHAAAQTYRWIATIPDDRPLNEELILEIHRRMVTGADDDHCAPGALRGPDQNVTFGTPPHRGAEGGAECERAFRQYSAALETEFRQHDPLIAALAAHYHLAAMHPFLDGNGRTARALEALMLQRAGLRDACFIPMSNYYYDEKPKYLEALRAVRAADYDLTPFLLFGLAGIRQQNARLLAELKVEVSKALFRDVMFQLFNRLKTPRRRVMVNRQLEILELLLNSESLDSNVLWSRMETRYAGLRNARKAFLRDLKELFHLKAIWIGMTDAGGLILRARLEWPTEITETEFFKRVKLLPKARMHPFLR